MAVDGRGEIVGSFSRQARAFAESPFQRDPERLRRILEWAAPRADETALDVACGPGIVTAALAAAGAFAVGVDLTAAMLRQAALDASRSGAPGRKDDRRAAFAQGEAERLPFRDACFDVVVCRNSFHHLEDPARVLVEMARVTRSGGRLVVEDMKAPDDPLARDYHEVIERLRDSAHIRTLTRAELLGLLPAAGLRRDRVMSFSQTLGFDEWIDRAYPAPAARSRARWLMEACVASPRGGLEVRRDGERLVFKRRSLILRAVRT